MLRRNVTLVLVMIMICLTFLLDVHAEGEDRWDDQVIYSIMIDRFHDGDPSNNYDVDATNPLAFHGGDLEGIIRRLDYIQQMNFTVIQLSSIFINEPPTFHGDSVHDYYQMERHFGSIEDLKRLVDEAHKRKMKVILEVPIVHTEDKTELEKTILEAMKWWVAETNLDGFKFIHFRQLSPQFWKRFIEEIQTVKSNIVITGMDLNLQEVDLNAYLEAGFTRIVNTTFVEELRKSFSTLDQPFTPLFNKMDFSFSQEILLDHQFTSRFTHQVLEEQLYPVSVWKRALTFMYTHPFVPVVYYGTEVAINGAEAPYNSPMMTFYPDSDLMQLLKRLGNIRKHQPALTKGELHVLYDKNGMLLYKRQYEDNIILVAINNSTRDQKVTIPASEIGENKELRGLLEDYLIRSSNDEFTIVIDRELFNIFKVVEETSINYYFLLIIFLIFGSFITFFYIAWKRGKK